MSAAGLQPIKWTKSQFVDLYDQGFLDHSKRYELLEGDILERMSPVGPEHGIVIIKLGSFLETQITGPYNVGSASSVDLSERSLPEPDILVMKVREQPSSTRFPLSTDIVFVAEVSDSTLSTDRGLKRRLYAQGGIPEYWIVNVTNRTVEIYRRPKDGDYSETLIAQASETVSLEFDPSVKVLVSKLFPKV